MPKNQSKKYYGIIIDSTTNGNNAVNLKIRLNNGETKVVNYSNSSKYLRNQRVKICQAEKTINVTSLKNERVEGTVMLFLPSNRALIVTNNGESLEYKFEFKTNEINIGDRVQCDATSFSENEKAEYGKAQNVKVIHYLEVNEQLADKICRIISNRFGNDAIPLSDCIEAIIDSGVDPSYYGFNDNAALFLEQFSDRIHINYENSTVYLADISETHGKYELAEKYIRSQNYQEMTLLQKRVFSDAAFWNRNRFLIAGSTSSGKTAIPITKYLIKRETSAHKPQMLIAVPLRALAAQMKQSMKKKLKDFGLDIAISTSEYDDRDEDILNGNVDIAIVIYEKIFIFCSEWDNFFNKYDIVVLDELNIYRNKERGIKAEVITLKLREECYPGELIMLGTPHCNWEQQVNKYGLYSIKVFSRPVKIHEFFFKNIFPGQDQKSSYRLFSSNGQPIEAGFHSTFEDTLVRLCKNEYMLNHKCIIFKFSQSQTRTLTKTIYKRLSQQLHLAYQSDEEVREFKKRFLRHYNIINEEIAGIYDGIDEFRALMNGIAYHNASLPENMRIALEQELLDEPKIISGGIKLVFATETIAYGLNSNVDTVIMTDMKKNDGKSSPDILRDDYQNCIGRAGRLGYLNYGTSYAFLKEDTINVSGTKQEDSIRYYRSDVTIDKKMKTHLADIMRNKNVDSFMFYFLNLCPGSAPFSRNDMVEILYHAANYRDVIKAHNELTDLVDVTLSCMENEDLISKLDDNELFGFDYGDETTYYRLTYSGKKLRGSVLFRDSFQRIKKIFSGISKDNSMFFFDLFYEFCDLQEIKEYCSNIVSSIDYTLIKKAFNERKATVDNDVKGVIRLAEYYMPTALEERLISQDLYDELMQSELFTLVQDVMEDDRSVCDYIDNDNIWFFGRLKLTLVSAMWLKGYSLSLINFISESSGGKLDNIKRKIGEKMSYLIDTSVAAATILGLSDNQVTVMRQASLSMFYGIDIELLKKRKITKISPENALSLHFASMYITKYKYLKSNGQADLQELWNQIDDCNDQVKRIIEQEGVTNE